MCIERVNGTFFLRGSAAGTCTQKFWELVAKIQTILLKILQTILPCFFEQVRHPSGQAISLSKRVLQKEKPKKIQTPLLQNTRETIGPVLQSTQSCSEEEVESIQSQASESEESEEEEIALSDAEESENSRVWSWNTLIRLAKEDPEFKRELLEQYKDPGESPPKEYLGSPPQKLRHPGKVFKGNKTCKLDGNLVVHQALNAILYKFSEGGESLLSDELDDILTRAETPPKKDKVIECFPRLAIVHSEWLHPETNLEEFIAGVQRVAKDHEDLAGGILYKGSDENPYAFGVIVRRRMDGFINRSKYYLIDPYAEKFSVHEFLTIGALRHYLNQICLGEYQGMIPVVFKRRSD